MILKSIRLKNIRSYKEQKVEFPSGSILLAGDIGSGKSSILQSVEFALFGSRRDSISGEALLRKGEKEGEVELEFDLDGRNIIIQRGLKRKQDSVAQESGFLMIDGQKVECTSTELKARMLELLGYPKELLTKSKSLVYRYTVYTPQEDMKRILLESDEERVGTLRRVFGIDRYKRIAENADIYIKRIKEIKKELLGVMQGLDEKKSELTKRKGELSAVELRKECIMNSLGESTMKKRAARDALDKIENEIVILNEFRKRSELLDSRVMEIVKNRGKNKTELDALESEISLLDAKIASAKFEEKVYPDQDRLEKEISETEKEISKISSDLTELSERKKHVEKRSSEISQELAVKSGKAALAAEKERAYKALIEEVKDKAVISKAMSDIDKSLRCMESKAAEVSAEKRSSEAIKDKVASLDTCPTCKQKVHIDHKHSIINEEDARIKELSARVAEIHAEKEKLSKILEENSKKVIAIAEKEMMLSGMDVELRNLSSLKQEIESLRQLQAHLDKEKSEVFSALEKLDYRIIERKKEEVTSKKLLLKEIIGHKMKLAEFNHDKTMLKDKDGRKEKLKTAQEQLKEDIRQVNSEKLKVGEEISKRIAAEKEFKIKKEELERSAEEEKLVEVRLGEARKEAEGINNYIMLLSKDIEVKENAARRLQSLTNIQEWFEKMFVNLMSSMERQIMGRVHTQFSELFSNWFDLLIEEEDISVRIDENFAPNITQNGHDTDIDHLSGGEKTSVALAYRLALNKVINDIISDIKTKDLIILDEPTDGFSSEQLDRVRNVLEELNMKQTIIVSHESKIESFVDRVIRIHKTEHVSRVI